LRSLMPGGQPGTVVNRFFNSSLMTTLLFVS
jgi:hypothetical protein